MLGVVAAAMVMASACRDPNPSARRRDRDRPVQEWEEETPQPTAEPADSTPLPPGWAEEIANAKQRQAAEEGRPGALSARSERGSPDGIDQTTSGGQDRSGAYPGAGAAPAADLDRRGDASDHTGLQSPNSRPKARSPVRPGNYLVMIAVLLVPLLLLIPVVWFWHLLRTFRLTSVVRGDATGASHPH